MPGTGNLWTSCYVRKISPNLFRALLVGLSASCHWKTFLSDKFAYGCLYKEEDVKDPSAPRVEWRRWVTKASIKERKYLERSFLPPQHDLVLLALPSCPTLVSSGPQMKGSILFTWCRINLGHGLNVKELKKTISPWWSLCPSLPWGSKSVLLSYKPALGLAPRTMVGLL